MKSETIRTARDLSSALRTAREVGAATRIRSQPAPARAPAEAGSFAAPPPPIAPYLGTNVNVLV